MRISLNATISKPNISFRAVSINSLRATAGSRSSIEETKREMNECFPEIDLKKNKEKRDEFEAEKQKQVKEEVTPSCSTRRMRKIVDRLYLEKINKMFQNNKEQEKLLRETIGKTEKSVYLKDRLKRDIESKEALQAKRIQELKNVVTGEYRSNRGFTQIAGYDLEKAILYKYFISEIKKEKNGETANVPSAVLFFGPKGNGKTAFATAFAQELGCESPITIKGNGINATFICKKFQTNLSKALREVQERYEKTKQTQVVLLDEFDLVANESSTILPELEDFLRNCYKKYHCIAFATTNYPLSIALNLNRENGAFPYIVSQDPPNKENKTSILKYYLSEKLPQDVSDQDYKAFTKRIEEKEQQSGAKYSIAQIRNKICEAQNNTRLTVDRVANNIENSAPNIAGEELEHYQKAMDTIMKNIIEE